MTRESLKKAELGKRHWPAAQALSQGAHDFFELLHAQLPILVFIKYSKHRRPIASTCVSDRSQRKRPIAKGAGSHIGCNSAVFYEPKQTLMI